MSRPLVVGLTGGIGSGKSAVADRFRALDVPVIDTDVIAREQVSPGQPALEQIRATFGDECLQSDGSLDRAELRRRVFAQPRLRAALEALLHPRIRQEVSLRLATLEASYCVVVVPLLVESGMNTMMDRIVVVDVPESVQVDRVQRRDDIDAELAARIVTAQASRDKRLAIADYVINNAGPLEDLDAQVAHIDRTLRSEAASRA